MNYDHIKIPRFLLEWLLDTAREHRAQNKWRRGTTYRNTSEMAEMDDNIKSVESYLVSESEA